MVSVASARRAATLRYSRHSRARKAAFALDFSRQRGVRSVLLVGVSKYNHPHENIVENALIQAGLRVIPTGIEPTVEGWANYLVADGRRLPFGDLTFDLVYSNAVIEHVGGERDQHLFVQELARVGRHWIFTTPNKWFPIEAHSDVFLKHWMPGWHDKWGSVTRLLSPATTKRILPPTGRIHGKPWSPTLTMTSS